MEPDHAPHGHGSSAPGDAAPLNGTLEDYSPAGILQVLSSQRETGAVRFSGESGCTVYLNDGELYFAETASTGEALAVALVRPGRLTADEWDDATQTGYPTSEVGQALIETGSIDREMLASVVLSIIYDPLIHLFRQGEGSFEFEPGTIHWMGPFRTFDLDAIVAEVRRRVREADEMAELIPHLGMWVTSARSLPADRGSVNLRRDDWEIAIAAAAGQRIDDLAVELGRGQWSTARLVYRLASAGLLEVGEAPDDAVVDHAAASPWDAAPDAATDATGFLDATTADTAEAEQDWSTPPPLQVVSDWATDPDQPQADSWAQDTAGGWETDETWGTDDVVTGTWAEPAAAVEDAAPDAWATPDAWAMPEQSASDDTVAAGWADAPAEGGAWDASTIDATTGTWGDDAPAAGLADAWDTSSDGWEPDGWNEEPAAVGDADADSGDHGITFDMPNLHPDIAKALAESTYADSATAINAMAARLGAAAEADTDEDWDDEEDGTFDDAWGTTTAAPWGAAPAETGDEAEAGAQGLDWTPSSWDTGVEAAPLPHRARSFADEEGPAGPADPEWLENLYSEFMSNPDDDAKRKGNVNPVEAAFTAAPEATQGKNKTLRRVISAIRRL